MTEKKEKPGTTIYINDNAIEALEKVDIEIMGMKIKKNSDKIVFLAQYYMEKEGQK